MEIVRFVAISPTVRSTPLTPDNEADGAVLAEGLFEFIGREFIGRIFILTCRGFGLFGHFSESRHRRVEGNPEHHHDECRKIRNKLNHFCYLG